MIAWIGPHEPFPPVESALPDPNGLLAASRVLHAAQLVDAYRRGIFPWYSENEPILWWSPDPRLVLRPSEFNLGRSLRKRLRQVLADPAIEIVMDRDFESTMHECAAPRIQQDGTWITPQVQHAYGELHERNLAHSVEVWADGRLVGGLYGVSLGRMFYGESMFSRQTDASKVALATLVRLMQIEQVALIDCQQETAHLMSLGAQNMARGAFCAHVAAASEQALIDWTPYRGRDLKTLLTEF
jgi:leucyl/phenylalanyl-tRNA---protein transferase